MRTISLVACCDHFNRWTHCVVWSLMRWILKLLSILIVHWAPWSNVWKVGAWVTPYKPISCMGVGLMCMWPKLCTSIGLWINLNCRMLSYERSCWLARCRVLECGNARLSLCLVPCLNWRLYNVKSFAFSYLWKYQCSYMHLELTMPYAWIHRSFGGKLLKWGWTLGQLPLCPSLLLNFSIFPQ